jgi:hypothetical protein
MEAEFEEDIDIDASDFQVDSSLLLSKDGKLPRRARRRRGKTQSSGPGSQAHCERVLVKWTDSPNYICNVVMGKLMRGDRSASGRCSVKLSALEGAIVVALGKP